MRGVVGVMERRQVPLYLAAILFGALVGTAAPSTAPTLAASITPILGALLFATFLGVPLIEVGRGFRDLRFVGAVTGVNFVAVPAVVWLLSRFVAGDRTLLVGILLVLLAPCVDYVIVFTGLAGGSREKLLAATPLLMLLQIVLLPVFLVLFAGAETVQVIDLGTFGIAFLALIVVPLVLAGIVQNVAQKHRGGEIVAGVAQKLMVPLMMATLAVVVGSQIHAVGSRIGDLLVVVPLYVAFLLVMPVIGLVAGRIARLDVATTRAVVFSGSTRNSLVVLPLALSLPAAFDLAPLVVVTQSLVELVGMVVLVRLVPLLVPRVVRAGEA